MNNSEQANKKDEDLILSGAGNVSKDCSNIQLDEWNKCLLKWKKNNFNKKPRDIEVLIRKGGIPEALRYSTFILLNSIKKLK